MELTPPVARYEQVARLLRQRIWSGEYPAGTTLRGAPRLAADFGVSQSIAQRALEQLEADGLVRQETGVGSVVLARHPYRVEVAVRWIPDGIVPEGESGQAAAALASAEGADPAVTDADLHASSGLLTVAMTVEAPDIAHAVSRAWAVTRRVLSGAGWDLAAAAVAARPEGEGSDSLTAYDGMPR